MTGIRPAPRRGDSDEEQSDEESRDGYEAGESESEEDEESEEEPEITCETTYFNPAALGDPLLRVTPKYYPEALNDIRTADRPTSAAHGTPTRDKLGVDSRLDAKRKGALIDDRPSKRPRE